MGDAAASALLANPSNTGLSTLEELLRIFRAATERGETVSLHSNNGGTCFQIHHKATSGIPGAAPQPKKLPAAAASVSVSSPPAARRKGPRSRGRGALLRDERRRQLKISPDVFARLGGRGRCPPPTIHRPTLSAPALDPGQEKALRRLAAYRELGDDASRKLVVVLLPAAPPQPTFRSIQPLAPRLRTRAWGATTSRCFMAPALDSFDLTTRWGGIPQLDGSISDALVCCSWCVNRCFKFEFIKLGWNEDTGYCPRCIDLDPGGLTYAPQKT
jgi:hypothetical protein